MCSIFVALSKNNNRVDHNKCREALSITKSRGPDNTYYTSSGKLFIGVNVLSLTGVTSVDTYADNKGILGYNGEFYNYDSQKFKSDTENLFTNLTTDNDYIKNTRPIEGMFCYAFFNKQTNDLIFARDIFGEKTLYIYEDDDLLLASSTLHGIEYYVGKLNVVPDLLYSYFYTRHFLTYNKTIYKNVRQIEPGTIEKYNILTNSRSVCVYESITDYIDSDLIHENERKSEFDIVSEFDSIFDQVISQMISQHHQCVSFSGGIDSSLIAYYINKHTENYSLVGTNCVNKDYISNNLQIFQPYFKNKIQTIDISEDEWCSHIKDVYNVVLQPFGSHNYCTKYILAIFLRKRGVRVLFGGEGADELFGGYDFYHKINSFENTNISPYSGILNTDVINDCNIKNAVKEKLDSIWDISCKIYKDRVLATSLADTLLVVSDDGIRNSDQVAGWFGIEGRSPFLHKKMLKFALNLPSRYKRGKPLLRALFTQKFPNISISAKQGFAGFPVETQNFFMYKDPKIFDVGDITQYDIPTQWKLLNVSYFYESYNSRDISRITRK